MPHLTVQDGEHNGVGCVEMSNIFTMQGDFLLIETVRYDTVYHQFPLYCIENDTRFLMHIAGRLFFNNFDAS